jgi:hypothetical protein
MMIRRLAVLTALSAVLIVAGCARDAREPAGSASPAASTSPAPPAAEPSAPEPSDAEPSAEATSVPGGQTISGTVTAGVESNCLLLSGDGAAYLLIFDDPAMRSQAEVGASITVVGRADPGMVSTCQQGTPFLVSSVRPN